MSATSTGSSYRCAIVISSTRTSLNASASNCKRRGRKVSRGITKKKITYKGKNTHYFTSSTNVRFCSSLIIVASALGPANEPTPPSDWDGIESRRLAGPSSTTFGKLDSRLDIFSQVKLLAQLEKFWFSSQSSSGETGTEVSEASSHRQCTATSWHARPPHSSMVPRLPVSLAGSIQQHQYQARLAIQLVKVKKMKQF